MREIRFKKADSVKLIAEIASFVDSLDDAAAGLKIGMQIFGFQ